MSVWDPLHSDLITSNRSRQHQIDRNRGPDPFQIAAAFQITGAAALPAGRSRRPQRRPVPATSPQSRPDAPPPPATPDARPASPIAAVIVPVSQCRRAPCSGRTGSTRRPSDLRARLLRPPPPELLPAGARCPTRPLLPSCSQRELDSLRPPPPELLELLPAGARRPTRRLLPSSRRWTRGSRPLTSCSRRWTALPTTAASLCLLPPTGPMSSTRLFLGLGGLIARSQLTGQMSLAVSRFLR
jgi:hypothetical protein